MLSSVDISFPELYMDNNVSMRLISVQDVNGMVPLSVITQKEGCSNNNRQ